MTAHLPEFLRPEGPPLLSISQRVATICLNRPSKRNRLENDDLATLLTHFATVQADASVLVLVLTACVNQPNPVFCAGYNVSDFEADEVGRIAFEQVPDALEQLNAITLCAINGSVFGGATDLALACDLRIGVHGMLLRMPAAALGLHYYPSGLRRYVARLGLQFAKRVFLTAQSMSDQELLTAGYLDQLVAPQALDAVVQSLIQQMTCLAPLALHGMKQSLNALGDVLALSSADVILNDIREREARCHASDDFVEGCAAFIQRRPPCFQGR